MKILHEYLGKPLPRWMNHRDGRKIYVMAYLPNEMLPIKAITSSGTSCDFYCESIEEIPPKPYFTDWSLVGEVIAGCAVDSNGRWHFFKDIPKKRADGVWISNLCGCISFEFYSLTIQKLDIDWKDSWLPNPNWRGLK